jgi:hypothetical protein
MLTEAIGEMLPAIMAIALTPLQLVGVVLVLGGPNCCGRQFACGGRVR